MTGSHRLLNGRAVVVALLLLGLIPLLVMPYLAISVANNLVSQQLSTTASSASSDLALYSDQLVLGRAQAVKILAARPDIRSSVSAGAKPAAAALAAIQGALPNETGCFVVASSGVVTAQVGSPLHGIDVATAGWLHASAQTITLLPASPTPRLLLTAPIPGGILGVETTLSSFAQTLSAYAGDNHVGILVTTAQGGVIDRAGTVATAALSQPDVTAAVAGHSSVAQQTVAGSSQSVAYSAAQSLHWVVRVSVPTAAGFDPVHSLTLAVVLLAAGLLAIFVAGLIILQTALRNQTRVQAALAVSNSRLQDAALHDPMTKVGNRALFKAELPRLVRQGGSLMMLDVDHFKSINDTLGHGAGDALLMAIAERLEAGVRGATDTVTRLGGDEFAVLLPGQDGLIAATMAERLQVSLRQALVVGGATINPQVSIGTASVAPGDTEATLMQRADALMYTAKHHSHQRTSDSGPA